MPCPGGQDIAESPLNDMRAAKNCDVARRAVEADTSKNLFVTPFQSFQSHVKDLTIHRDIITDDAQRYRVQRLASSIPHSLHMHYTATSDDDGPLVLKVVSPWRRALRSELYSIKSEATLLRWLADVRTDASGHQGTNGSDDGERESQVDGEGEEYAGDLQGPDESAPKLFKHGRLSVPEDVEFLLTRPIQGVLISSLDEPLTRQHRTSIDFQIGQLIHAISIRHSPCGRFGLTSAVLDVGFHPVASKKNSDTGPRLDGHVYTCWSDAFTFLLESVLRDAEDAALALQYDKLRHHTTRFKNALDEVTIPSLVVLDAGQDSNTLILAAGGDESCGSQSSGQENKSATTPPQEHIAARSSSSEPASHTPEPDLSEAPKVVGVRDWHNSVFGDPDLTSVLCCDDNADILAGMSSQRDKTQVSALTKKNSEHHLDARRSLYACYHALVTIVTEYYRVSGDGVDRELPARKKLLQSLNKLDSLKSSGV